MRKKVYVIGYYETEMLRTNLMGDWKMEELGYASFYKIGFGKDPESRVKSLQAGTPHILKIVAVVESDSARYVEQRLHSLLHMTNYRGEWFNFIPTNLLNSLKGLDRLDRGEAEECIRGIERCLAEGSSLYTDVVRYRKEGGEVAEEPHTRSL